MYTLSYPSGTFRKDGIVFAQDDRDPAWIAYALWLAADNGPTEIADQEVPPARQHLTASPYKIRQALSAAGMRQSVEDFVANCGDQKIQDAWEYSTEWSSDSPLIVGAIVALGMSEDQVYSLFELAKTL